METTTTMGASNGNLVKLCDFERNGPQESDFYVVLFNVETGEITCDEYATTRWASSHDLSRYLNPTREQAESARQALAGMIFARLVEADKNDTTLPQDVSLNMRVVLLSAHKNQAKEHDLAACVKCNGTGLWVNPRDCADKRTCFACAGKGVSKSNERKVKTADGKPEWVKFAPGLKGKVVWSGTFRTIYRNGYNKLDRSTIQCKVLLDDGRTMSVPLSKLGLDRALASHDELKARAEELSHDLQFGALFPHFCWETRNWARQALQAKE
jgi:hypothetical protein